MTTADIVIIGGGVIGCAAAYELSGAGLKVVVLEKDHVGSGASSASAGLIVPLHATDDGQRTPLFNLYWASSCLFPELVSELQDATGMQVDYDPSGSMRIATDEDEHELLKASFREWDAMDELTVEWVDGNSLRKSESDLSPDVLGGVISRDEQSLHPGRFTKALARGALSRGAQIRTGTPVTSIRHKSGRFVGVSTPDEDIDAGELLIAAGAWSRTPCSWLGIDIPISPARGQMVSIRADAASLSRPLFSYNGAVLPKPDGTVHVGSTVELVGFDTRPTADGISAVLEMIPRLVPGLSQAPLEATWTGLRPWCEDGIPAIGRLPGCDRITLASGHFKMGILGSPITARTITRLIVDQSIDPLIAPFSPERFTGTTE